MCVICWWVRLFLFFKQKTAYEMRISDWSSDVCSSDLLAPVGMGEMPNRAADHLVHVPQVRAHRLRHADAVAGIGSRTVEIDRIGFEMAEDQDRKSVV